jgi:hypothetical protein
MFVCILCITAVSTLQGQVDSSQKTLQSLNKISNNTLDAINNRYIFIDKLVEKQTEKILRRMQKKEAVLQKRMQSKDSLKAKELFANTQAQYQELLNKLHSPTSGSSVNVYKQYLPVIDSLQTSLNFLDHNSAVIPGISSNKLQKMQLISQQLQQLQTKFDQSDEIQNYIRQREQLLRSELSQLDYSKQLLGINKQVYYYQQQLAEYKDLLNDKQKMEEVILSAVRQVPSFQSFWQKYSILASLFPMPSDYGTPQALNGLQTRADIQNILQQNGVSLSANTQNVQQLIQQSQSELNTLKNKISNLGGTNGSGDMTMPDFKPNDQHTKSFLHRIEYGFNVQNASGTNLLPTTSTIALTIGYKINDNTTVGTGISYILGLGRGLNDISFSNQGIGYRSYLDIRAKGSLWISGGLEYNHYEEFNSIRDIKNIQVWQKSALIGLTKKYSIGKRTANMQLLYDLLYSTQLPKVQPIKFRIGYSL